MASGSKTQHFASDNYAGICPQAWDMMEQANRGHAPAYGDDEWTALAAERIRETFATDCEVFFVFNGTAGNGLALAALCQSYHGVICHQLAHIETDECGAPGFFSGGVQLIAADGVEGKLTPGIVAEIVARRDDLHFSKPHVVSLTQATEAGTLYSVQEVQLLCDTAGQNNLKVHMDGARFANAVAALGCKPRDLTVDCGVDVLCLGGTKNGMAVGDAIIFFNRDLAREFEWRCKQAGQLASKMRFLTAPWITMLEQDRWLKNAGHANNCAELLERRLRKIAGVTILFPRQVNCLYVSMEDWAFQALAARGWRFYIFPEAGGARFMCSWDTEKEQVERFADDIEEILSTGSCQRTTLDG